MLPVFRLGFDAEIRVEQELVAIESDVVLTVRRRDENPDIVLGIDQLAAHLRDDVIKNAAGVVGSFANKFHLEHIRFKLDI